MNKILLTGLCTCIYALSWSQQNTVSSGGEATGSGGTVSYSVGQIDYINSTGSNGNVNQGVQQPYEFFLASLEDGFIVDVNLYPNPTSEFIILEFQDISSNVVYLLHDTNGKLLAEGKIEALETQIDMRGYAKGQYHLSLRNESNQVYPIKIVKN